MTASHNFLEYVEFIYYLQEYGYSDFLKTWKFVEANIFKL
jgi:hypothetical protein